MWRPILRAQYPSVVEHSQRIPASSRFVIGLWTMLIYREPGTQIVYILLHVCVSPTLLAVGMRELLRFELLQRRGGVQRERRRFPSLKRRRDSGFFICHSRTYWMELDDDDGGHRQSRLTHLPVDDNMKRKKKIAGSCWQISRQAKKPYQDVWKKIKIIIII